MQDCLVRYRQLLIEHPTKPMTELLPLIFKLKGKPYSLVDHFPHEPIFRITGEVPRRQVIKAGRQVAKSTGQASCGILRAAMVPFFNHLTVTPLFEQVRKFSSNYVKPFITESSVKTLLRNAGADNSVLQRTLPNGSNLFYNYASNSADRIRGTPADEVDADEMQDFDLDVLPIIESCLGASPYKIMRYSGTPKTSDGPLEVYWLDSSQGIWHIICDHCGYDNDCSADGDLLKMVDDPITLVCGKCKRPVDSSTGFYVHRFPERRVMFPGYHMPQVIFPMHYRRPVDWQEVQNTRLKKPKFVFYNECLGESCDTGTKLLTIQELQGAAKLKHVDPADFHNGKYIKTALGVDWGGKGKEKTTDKDDFVSNTALALAGLRGDGVVEIPWLFKTPYTADHYEEADLVLKAAGKANVDWIAHDFGGAGNVRESIVLHQGWPYEKIAPLTYSIMSVNKPIIFYAPAGQDGARSSWTIDKTRAILLFCALVKTRKVLFVNWEDGKECLDDFFSIFEESIDGPRNSQRTLVKRLRKRTDDIVHACVFATMVLFHSTDTWPDIAEAFMKLEGDDEVWRKEDV